MSNLKNHIIKSFDKDIIVLNGKEYVSVDVFQSAISELAVMESLLGSLVLRLNKNISIKEEDAIDYMCKSNEKVDIEFIDGTYLIKINNNQ